MTRRLRVLIVEPTRQGHWHYTLAVARALSQRVDVRLATLFPFESLDGIGEMPVSIIGRRIQASNGRLRYPFRKALIHAEKICGLVRVVREFRPDVVHLHAGLGQLDSLYFEIIKLLGARVVYTAHDLPSSRWLNVSNRLRYRAADLIVVHSLNSIADLRNYGVDESRIQLLPHVSPLSLGGMTVLPNEEAKASLGLPAETRVLLFFGHITSRKGLDLLIDAHAILCREHSHVYMIIAGEAGEDFTPYLKRIADSGLSSRVILDLRYIPLDRMQVYFSAADVIVLPYRRIYQSHVLQWAYTFGRPVVVTDVGGIKEAVAADGTGLIADKTDGEGLARSIRRLLTDRDLARAMGDRGLQMARTKYSDEAVSEKLESIYRDLVSD